MVASPACLRCAGGLDGGREFGDGAAGRHRLFDVGGRRVVMARQHDAGGGEQRDHLVVIAGDGALGALDPVGDLGVDVGAALADAGEVHLQVLDIAPLPRAGRVVHQRGQREVRPAHRGVHQLRQRPVGELAAQMDAVVDAEQAVRGALLHRVQHDLVERASVRLGLVEAAGADGVIDRGDAGGGHLPVMGQRGGTGVRPDHLRPGHEMAFQRVGVQVDQAGREIGALAVDGACDMRAALVDRADAPVLIDQRAVDDAVFEDEADIGENRFHGRASRMLV